MFSGVMATEVLGTMRLETVLLVFYLFFFSSQIKSTNLSITNDPPIYCVCILFILIFISMISQFDLCFILFLQSLCSVLSIFVGVTIVWIIILLINPQSCHPSIIKASGLKSLGPIRHKSVEKCFWIKPTQIFSILGVYLFFNEH